MPAAPPNPDPLRTCRACGAALAADAPASACWDCVARLALEGEAPPGEGEPASPSPPPSPG